MKAGAGAGRPVPCRFARGDTDGWTNTHLHKFYIDRAGYGKPADFDKDVLNEANTSLAQVLRSRVKGFTYVYDFGDNWVA